MNTKRSYQLIILEFITILLNVLIYQGLFLFINHIIAGILSLIISNLFNYLICLKVIYKEKYNFKKMFVFIFLTAIGVFVKRYIVSISSIYASLFGISKIISNGFSILYGYIFKMVLFDKTKKSLKEKVSDSFKSINKTWNKFISLKVTKVVFKVLPTNIFLFIFLLGSIYYSFWFIKNNDNINYYQQWVTDSTVGPILLNNSYEITFDNIEINGTIDRIGILFATYARTNNADLKFRLYDNNNKKVYEKDISMTEIKDAKLYYLSVPDIDGNKIKNYHLKISSPNATSDNCVTIFMNSETNAPAIVLEKTPGLFSIKHIIICCYILIFLCLNYFINKKKIEPHKFYTIMLIYMVSILFIYPPLEVPDEPIHVARAINISQNLLNVSKVSNMNVPEKFEYLSYSGIQFRDMVVNVSDVRYCLNSSKNETMHIMFGVTGLFYGAILGYLGSGIMLKIVDVFTNIPLLIFFAGRLGNLIFAFYLTYKAIKICPTNKRVLLFIATIPMLIQQMASYSYDSVLNAVCLLIFAYSLSISKGLIKINWKVKINILLLLSFIASIKVIYLPIAVLFLFPAKKQFKNNKSRFLYYATILFGTYLIFYLLKNNFFVLPKGIGAGSLIPQNGQLEYLKSNPLQIFTIAYNTLKINGFWYLRSLFGYFSWFKFGLSHFTVISIIIFYITLILSEKNEYFDYHKKKNVRLQKAIIILSILIVIGIVFGSMYLSWSAYMLNYVEGVQGRYFLPVLPLFTLVCIPKKNKIKISDGTVYMFINIVLIQYIVYSITYFY